jgi:uncharacterized membrane protein
MNDASPAMSAKYPRSIIAGPYGHPFHPIAVIIPIGSWVSALIFDIIAFIGPLVEPFAIGARILIIIGLIGAVVAAILGLIDWSGIPKGTPARTTGLTHAALNVVVMGLFVVSLLLRLDTDDEIPTLAFLCALAGVLLLSASGWLGGKLAHTYGVRVASETTQAEGMERMP